MWEIDIFEFVSLSFSLETYNTYIFLFSRASIKCVCEIIFTDTASILINHYLSMQSISINHSALAFSFRNQYQNGSIYFAKENMLGLFIVYIVFT